MSVVVCNRGGKIDGAKWEVGLGPGDTAAPTFRPMSIVAKWLDGLRCHLVRRRASADGFGPGHIVLDGDPDPLPKRAQHRPRPPPKKGHIPQFSAHVCCVKRQDGSRCHLVRRKLSPGHCVGWGRSLPPKGAQQPLPLFGPCLFWPNRRPSTAETLYNGRPKT